MKKGPQPFSSLIVYVNTFHGTGSSAAFYFSVNDSFSVPNDHGPLIDSAAESSEPSTKQESDYTEESNLLAHCQRMLLGDKIIGHLGWGVST